MVMYKKHLMRSKAQTISGKLLLRWSEHLVINRIVNRNNVSLADTETRRIVRNARVSLLKRYYL
jgi:hypothetical protein